MSQSPEGAAPGFDASGPSPTRQALPMSQSPEGAAPDFDLAGIRPTRTEYLNVSIPRRGGA